MTILENEIKRIVNQMKENYRLFVEEIEVFNTSVETITNTDNLGSYCNDMSYYYNNIKDARNILEELFIIKFPDYCEITIYMQDIFVFLEQNLPYIKFYCHSKFVIDNDLTEDSPKQQHRLYLVDKEK